MNANIETALMSLIGNDPRFQRAMTMLQGKTPAEMQQLGQNQHRRQISFRDFAQLLFRLLSFRHLQVQLPLLLNNKLVVS